MIGRTRFLIKILIIGTKAIYKVVIKPALPTVVYITPNCCKLDATKSAAPQNRPPMMETLSFSQSKIFCGAPSAPAFFLLNT